MYVLSHDNTTHIYAIDKSASNEIIINKTHSRDPLTCPNGKLFFLRYIDPGHLNTTFCLNDSNGCTRKNFTMLT